MSRDAREFGPVVDALVGRPFERTLAINSLKLRFGVTEDPRGAHYLWIDPAWEFRSGNGIVTTSDDYDEATFQAWGRLFDPLDRNVLVSWEVQADDSVIFCFEHGYSLRVPYAGDEREDNLWYAHWYARVADI